MKFPAFLLSLFCLALPALAEAPKPVANPLLEEWNTPFGIAPYDRIRDEHFLPAYDVGIAAHRAEIAAIESNTEAPSFANTVEALERSGRLLDKVESAFGSLNSADTNEQRQAIARTVAPKLAALSDDIRLSKRLFDRVNAVYSMRTELGLSPEQLRLLEESYKGFVRGGAKLQGQEKERLRAINQELSKLGVRFGENLLKETNAFRLLIDDPAELAGLPERVRAGAAAEARKVGEPGKWLFTLQAPSIWPFLENADNRALRKRMLDAYAARCSRGNEQDNRALLSRIAVLRAERSALLGHATYADFSLERAMAGNPARVSGLLDKLWTPALAMAKREAAAMQEQVRAEGGGFALEASDWRYYASKVKRARYAYDEQEMRPYFQLDAVRDGAFEVAHRLYGLSFREVKGLPLYNPEVRAFEVLDADGSHLGLFLTDYHPRPGKRSGAWSSRLRSQCFEDGKDIRPIVVNVCNFSRPSGDEPALLSMEEVETLFHEFGHGLHSLLSRIPYRGLAGVPRDFVELPSQVMENWATEPEVLAFYARHYKTGAPLPPELLAKYEASRKFNQGFATVEYLAASYLDMEWHKLPAGSAQPDADALEKGAMERIGLIPEILPRYRSAYYQHIFAGGYAAGYYSYIWSEVLDADAFQAFKETSLFDAKTAKAFRDRILSRGNSADAAEMYRDFRGRDPEVGPLLKRRGLE